MATPKLTILFLLIALYSCGQKSARHKSNPEVVRLCNKIIPLVSFTDNPDSCRKALVFLDSATAIDSNDFLAYYDKLMFLYGLKEYDKAIMNVDKLISLRPSAHDLFMTKGGLYEKKGDTTSSKLCFQKSLSICNAVLDTMSSNNSHYLTLTLDQAIDTIFLGYQIKGNQILQQLYDKQTDTSYKEYILSFMNKNKEQLLNFNQDKYSR